jgi:hypothetical protein
MPNWSNRIGATTKASTYPTLLKKLVDSQLSSWNSHSVQYLRVQPGKRLRLVCKRRKTRNSGTRHKLHSYNIHHLQGCFQ